MAKGDLKAVGTAAELMMKTNTKTLEDAFVSLASQKEAE
jgi:ABC-2 type transport system ATP-binding protein